MSLFDDVNQTTNKASDIGERYIKTSHQYFKLKVFQQLTLSMSTVAKIAAVGLSLYVGLLFFSVALTIKLSQVFESWITACLLVGVGYVVLAVIIYLLKSKIDQLIIKKTGSKFFK